MMFQIKNGEYIDIPKNQILELITSSLYEEINCSSCGGTCFQGKYDCYSCHKGKITVVSDFGKELLDFFRKEIKLTVSS